MALVSLQKRKIPYFKTLHAAISYYLERHAAFPSLLRRAKSITAPRPGARTSSSPPRPRKDSIGSNSSRTDRVSDGSQSLFLSANARGTRSKTRRESPQTKSSSPVPSRDGQRNRQGRRSRDQPP